MAVFNFSSPTSVGNVLDGASGNQVSTFGQTTTLIQQSNTYLQNIVVESANVSLADAYANDYVTLQVSKSYADALFANGSSANTDSANAYTDAAISALHITIDGEIANANAQIYAYVANVNSDLRANDFLTLQVSQSYTDQANLWLQANFSGENSAISQANTYLQNEKIITSSTVVVNAGVKDIIDALNETSNTAQLLHINLSSGSFPGANVAIVDRVNQVITGASSPTTTASTYLPRSFTISGDSSIRNHLMDLNINGDFTIDGTQGRHVLQNIFVDTLTISGNGSGFLQFIECMFDNVVITGDWTLQTMVFDRCNFSGGSVTNDAGAIVLVTESVELDYANSTNINVTGLNQFINGEYSLVATTADVEELYVQGTAVASESYVDTANTYLQNLVTNTSTSDRVYADGIVSANASATLSSAQSYTDTANTYLQNLVTNTSTSDRVYADGIVSANASATLSSAQSYTDTTNTFLQNVITTSDASTLSSAYANDTTTLASAKAYTDAVASGLDAKDSVVTATTPAVGNITLSGEQTISSITLVDGDRVLVKDQTNPIQNGIYIVSAGSWTRAPQADTWYELEGAYVFVKEGTTDIRATGWVCNIPDGGTIGTDPISWTQFSAPGYYTAGSGLELTGSIFSVANTVSVTNFSTANGTISSAPVSGTDIVNKTYADGVGSNTLSSAQSYTDTANTYLQNLVTNTSTSDRVYADGIVSANASATLSSAQGYADGIVSANASATLSSAQSYTNTANTFLQANDAITLASANANTAEQITALNLGTISTQNSNNVNITGGSVSVSDVTVSSFLSVEYIRSGGSVTLSGTSQQRMDIIDSGYSGATYDVFVTNSDTSETQISQLHVIANTTAILITEFGILNSSSTLATYDVATGTAGIDILATPTLSGNNVFRWTKVQHAS